MINREAKRGLNYKLIRVFILQIVLISLTTMVAVISAGKVVEDLLIKQALEGEAAYFWALYKNNSDTPRPNVMNMKGYLAVKNDKSGVPTSLHRLEPGYTRAKLDGREPLVYVEDRDQARLYLVFDEEQVTALSFYFGIVPLALVLISIYLIAWLSYNQTRKAISPIVKLAHRVEQFNFREQNLANLQLDDLRNLGDSEITILVDAMDHFTERLQSLIERERNFTRDASHELRTPLAVIKSSLALLQKQVDYQTFESKPLVLIERALGDMETLLDTLLLLAREESSSLPVEDIVINDLLSNLVEKISHFMNKPQIKYNMEFNCILSVEASEKVLNIVFGNLLRNAFSYTEHGLVSIHIDPHSVSIKDSGVGIDKEMLEQVFEPFYRGSHDKKGHGLGLSIVKQLCQRFGWQLTIRSKPGDGTTVRIFFPDHP